MGLGRIAWSCRDSEKQEILGRSIKFTWGLKLLVTKVTSRSWGEACVELIKKIKKSNEPIEINIFFGYRLLYF